MGRFKRAGENLVRHTSGTLYLRIKVGGKVIRESLETDSLEVAKMKRDQRVLILRSRSAAIGGKIKTLREALEIIRHRQMEGAHLKQSTKDYYEQVLGYLEESLPLPCSARAWSEVEAREWWQATAERYSWTRANAMLAACKRMVGVILEAGARADDPTRGLKPVREAGKELVVPTRERMGRIIASAGAMRRKRSKEVADMIAVMAFSGVRAAEARALRWGNVGEEWLTVTGGKEGTKNRQVRRVPISPPLRDVLDGMEKKREMLFALNSPRFALAGACKRLKLPHMRVHDLRHFFASWSLMSGVDVPTVSRWLGHGDGGTLVLKTYGHLTDDHSLKSALKLE